MKKGFTTKETLIIIVILVISLISLAELIISNSSTDETSHIV